MDGTENAWDQQPGESRLWFARFERYRLLVPPRSFLEAYRAERREKGLPSRKSNKKYDNTPGSWRNAAKKFHWEDRADAWDAHCREAAAAEVERRRISALSSGFALQHERVIALNEVATTLLDEFRDTDKRWVADVKGIGRGEDFREVEIVRFNAGVIKQLRGALDDIAKEMGQRSKIIDLKATKPLAVKVIRGVSMEDL